MKVIFMMLFVIYHREQSILQILVYTMELIR